MYLFTSGYKTFSSLILKTKIYENLFDYSLFFNGQSKLHQLPKLIFPRQISSLKVKPKIYATCYRGGSSLRMH